MAFLLVDDGFAEHPKIGDLSDRGFRLHVAALCYCARNLTDGFVSERSVRVLCALTRASKRNLIELVDAGVWLEHDEDGCYLIHDYLEHNPTAAEVKERRQKRSEAGRLGGLRSGEARAKANAEANASPNAEAPGLNPIPSHVNALEGVTPLGAVRETIEQSLKEAGR